MDPEGRHDHEKPRVEQLSREFRRFFARSEPRILIMVSGKRLADIGYRTFTTSMLLLTAYGGYLCAMRGYRYMERQKQLKLAAENQDSEVIKD